MSQVMHEMKGNQFPFGILSAQNDDLKKIFIKKRYVYRSANEHAKLKEKIDKLKTIVFKNTINLRSAEDNSNGYIDLFYPYVSISLEDFFVESSPELVKDLHRQFIQLAIYLAKNYILTSFNPNRCGIIVKEDKPFIKYYLPLNQIMVTNKVSMLERSVQLFNVQSLHYLDTLTQSVLNTTIQNSSQRSFKSKNKASFHALPQKKDRRDTQPAGFFTGYSRRLSTNAMQLRKLSNLSKELSEISEMYKLRNTKQSTRISRISGSSLGTIRNILQEKSSEKDLLKKYAVETEGIKSRVSLMNDRSKRVLNRFEEIKEALTSEKQMTEMMRSLKK